MYVCEINGALRRSFKKLIETCPKGGGNYLKKKGSKKIEINIPPLYGSTEHCNNVFTRTCMHMQNDTCVESVDRQVQWKEIERAITRREKERRDEVVEKKKKKRNEGREGMEIRQRGYFNWWPRRSSITVNVLVVFLMIYRKMRGK